MLRGEEREMRRKENRDRREDRVRDEPERHKYSGKSKMKKCGGDERNARRRRERC